MVGIYWAIRESASSRVKLDWLGGAGRHIKLDQVEGVEEYAPVSALVPDEIERGDAVFSGKRGHCRDGYRALPARRVLRAMIRKPSCLISCSHWPPEGSLSVLVGRHGAMNPAGRVRCNMLE